MAIKSAIREKEILRAAETLFAAHGFHAVGVDAIGADAGITASTIYRHFSGKDEILGALFEEATAELLLRLDPPHEEPSDELAHLVNVHFDFTVERTKLATIWQHEQRSLTALHRRNFVRGRDRYILRWLSCLSATYPNRRRDELAAAMNAAQAAIMSVTLRSPKSDVVQLGRVIKTQVIAGLATLGNEILSTSDATPQEDP